MITQQEVQNRLHTLVVDYLTRGHGVRDAVARGLKVLADESVQASNMPSDVRVSEEDFEKLVAGYERLLEKYRAEQERGAVPVGGGVYAEIVSDDEYQERVAKGDSEG
jgi:hypothetical protein